MYSKTLYTKKIKQYNIKINLNYAINMTKEKTISIRELSKKEPYFNLKGSIKHLDSEFVYVLRSEGGLKQYIEIFKKNTLQKVKTIDLREQNFSSIDSNENYIAIVYKKAITEIWDKSNWNLQHSYTYDNTIGYTAFMTEDILLVSLYSHQSAIYFYDKDQKTWEFGGYPSLHTSPFLGTFYHDGLVYTGALYEEILISDIKPEGFRKIEYIDTWCRYVDCIRVDNDYIYHHGEGFLGVYDKAEKKIVEDYFDDHYSGDFDIDENYLFYSKEKEIVMREKKSWKIKNMVNTENIQATDVFVDTNNLYFNDNEGNFYQISKDILMC